MSLFRCDPVLHIVTRNGHSDTKILLNINPSTLKMCGKITKHIGYIPTKKDKCIPFIFNDESSGSCICLRLDLCLSRVKIGARHLGSLCSILPFSHKKIPQTGNRYVCGKLHPRNILSSSNFHRQMPLRTQKRQRPWRQNLELRVIRLAYKRRDVICEVRGTRLLYIIHSCKTYPC
jgi:hypothetical protein